MMRRFRRQMRRGMNPQVPPILQEANMLLDQGDFLNAAEKFEQMGIAAQGRGGPRAPMFFLQSGRAYLMGKQNAQGLDALKKGLNLLAERGQFPRLHKAGTRVGFELQQQGLKSEAEGMQGWLKSVMPNYQSMQTVNVEAAKHPVLPTHCPSCGASLKPDEVEWLDDFTAECAYCGSPVRDE